MGKWAKYSRDFNDDWSKDSRIKDWVRKTPDELIAKGKPKAYCKYCDTPLRAHLNGLVKHGATQTHKDNAQKFNRSSQPTLHNYGAAVVSDQTKVAEMKLAVFIATHCSVKTVDHLGELIAELGKGSALENVKLHRTKCSKLISNVIAPAYLKELIEDVGDSMYSLIVDEVTDNSTSKFMGICIRYFSKKYGEMITDFLGLVPVTGCTGKELSDATKTYLREIGLPLLQLKAIGVDGAANMCGHINSYYTHLKQDVPHLLLFKCVCHTIDKCAQHAFSALPQEVGDLINDTNMYFAHSALRWDEYTTYFKAMRDGKEPKKMIPLSKTRWLVWVPAAENIFDQWYELKGFFTMKASNPKGNEKAVALTKLYTSSTLLYITFLKNVLLPVQKVSKAFEQTNADITKVYTELRTVAMTLAGRILKPQCMTQAARPGMLRSEEAKVIENALNNPANLLPVDRTLLGDAFARTAQAEKLTPEELEPIRHKCGAYIFTLTKLLMSKLPGNLDAVAKLRFLTPRMVLATTARPTFQQLPLELGVNINRDELESQWVQLGTLPITEIMDLEDPETKLEDVDTVQFWASVLKLKNACGEAVFEKLANFALAALTLPISNAVVERAFSVMSCIKCRRRNRLQLIMLEALMRLRIHLKVIGLCCKSFKPSREMLRNFTSDMYRTVSRRHPGDRVEAAFEQDPDDPQEIGVQLEETGDLEEVDYEIVSMLDATTFDENLLVVTFE